MFLISATFQREPLKCVIEKYAEQMGVDASTLRLVFDGEDVDPRDTPGKLDMEDLDVVDVIMTRWFTIHYIYWTRDDREIKIRKKVATGFCF